MDRFCRADHVSSSGETEDDSSYSGLSLDILYSRGGSGLLDWLADRIGGTAAMVLRQKLQMRG